MNTPICDATSDFADRFIGDAEVVPAHAARQLERDRARLINYLSLHAEALKRHGLSSLHIINFLESLEIKE